MSATLIEPKIEHDEHDEQDDKERPLHIAKIEGIRVALCGFTDPSAPWQPYVEIRRRGLCAECVAIMGWDDPL